MLLSRFQHFVAICRFFSLQLQHIRASKINGIISKVEAQVSAYFTGTVRNIFFKLLLIASDIPFRQFGNKRKPFHWPFGQIFKSCREKRFGMSMQANSRSPEANFNGARHLREVYLAYHNRILVHMSVHCLENILYYPVDPHSETLSINAMFVTRKTIGLTFAEFLFFSISQYFGKFWPLLCCHLTSIHLQSLMLFLLRVLANACNHFSFSFHFSACC